MLLTPNLLPKTKSDINALLSVSKSMIHSIPTNEIIYEVIKVIFIPNWFQSKPETSMATNSETLETIPLI